MIQSILLWRFPFVWKWWKQWRQTMTWHDLYIITFDQLQGDVGLSFKSPYLTQWAQQCSWQTGGFFFPATGIARWEIDWSNLAFNEPFSGQRDKSVILGDHADSSGALFFWCLEGKESSDGGRFFVAFFECLVCRLILVQCRRSHKILGKNSGHTSLSIDGIHGNVGTSSMCLPLKPPNPTTTMPTTISYSTRTSLINRQVSADWPHHFHSF